MDGSTVDLEELRRAIDGDVVVAGSPAFDTFSKPFNARFDDGGPQAVVRCTSAGDVAETVSFIRRHGLRSATRSGGHCFAGRSTTSGVLVDVTPMRSVAVADGVVRIGAGARLGEVYLGTMAHGLTIPGGTCPSVGIAGLTLGGGLGILGRMHGVTSDRLVGARVVLADGRTVGCDEHHQEELFWALRGAGTGHFGVVTDLVFRPVPAPIATSFHLTWSFPDAATVAEAWLGWSPVATDELAASLVVAASADPEQDPSVEVFGTMMGTGSDTQELIGDLTARVNVDPTSTFLEEMSYGDTLRYWAARAGERLDEPRAEPGSRGIHFIKSEFFAMPLVPEAISALLDHLAQGRIAGQSRELDLSPWGGAYNRMRPDATAFVHRDALFWVKHAADVDADASATERAAAHRWVTGSWGSVHRWGTGRVFPNFPDPDLDDWGHAYYGDNYERLLEVKARYDPENVFRFPQSLPVG
jgi:FAD/FMN-containing dehydrogenase